MQSKSKTETSLGGLGGYAMVRIGKAAVPQDGWMDGWSAELNKSESVRQ